MELQSIALPTELPSLLLREHDLNLRPSGYEPDELPSCSIPRQYYQGGCGIRTHARFYTPDGFQDRSLQPDLGNPPKKQYSPYGIRTRVTAVKRRCLNPLTNGPYNGHEWNRTTDLTLIRRAL